MISNTAQIENALARMLIEHGPSKTVHEIRSVLSNKSHINLVDIKNETNSLLSAEVVAQAAMVVGDPYSIEGMEVKRNSKGATLIPKEYFLKWIAVFIELLAEEFAKRGLGEDRVSLGIILKTSKTLPYTYSEFENVISLINKNRARGLNTGIDPIMERGVEDCLARGVVAVCLGEVDTSIVFIKQDAGKGLLGRQKAMYGTYLSPIGQDSFLPGTTFKKWLVAVTAMNNIYRGEGLL